MATYDAPRIWGSRHRTSPTTHLAIHTRTASIDRSFGTKPSISPSLISDVHKRHRRKRRRRATTQTQEQQPPRSYRPTEAPQHPPSNLTLHAAASSWRTSQRVIQCTHSMNTPRTETVTMRVRSALKKRLEKLARSTGRSRSFLATEAIAAYLDTNEWQISGIVAALSSLDRGTGIPHEQVGKWIASWETSQERPSP